MMLFTNVPLCVKSCLCLGLLALSVYQPVFSQSQDDLSIDGVSHFDVMDNPFVGIYDLMKLEDDMRHRMVLPSGEVIVLDLVHADLFGAHYQQHSQLTEGVRAIPLRGWTDQGGAVRLTVAPDMAYGYIQIDDDSYWFEPLWHHTGGEPSADRIVIYKASDVDKTIPGGCGVTDAHHHGTSLSHHSPTTQRVGQCYEVELAIASDFSMFTKYGGATGVENRNIGVINNVNGDYSGAFADDLVFNIVTQFISNCSTCDPWTSSTDAPTLLNSFTSWGNSGGFGVGFDVGELWSDRNFDGSTIGLAWVGGVCSNVRYHILEDFTANAQLIRTLTSHEIGHNFDASHVSGNFIMAPTVSTTMNWSSTTVSTINAFVNQLVNSGGCLSPCPLPGDAPEAAFTASHDFVCAGSLVEFNDLSTNEPTSWSWSFPGGTPSFSLEEHPTIRYSFPGNYAVTLTVTNAFGTDVETINGYIVVENGGEELIAYQDFDDGLGDWDINNPDNGRTWQSTFLLDAPSGVEVMRMNNVNYNVGQRDGITSPLINLVGRSSARVTVDYAYALRPGAAADSLVVSVSTDGGSTYHVVDGIAEDGSGNMATVSPTTNFEPELLTDWCSSSTMVSGCLDVDLSPYTNNREVYVRVENVSQGGNNMYVDRIAILAGCFSLAPPVADFIVDDTEGCATHFVQFQDASTNFPHTYEWLFPGGNPSISSDPNPFVIYNQPGLYEVSLCVTNEVGMDEIIRTDYIVVRDLPLADFSKSRVNDGIQFTHNALDADTYNWDFGDGTVSSMPSPYHEYQNDGIYTVTLTVTNECGSDMVSDTVQITSPTSASFLSPVTTICVGGSISFINQSGANAVSFNWLFPGGQPSTSTEENPSVLYDSSGVYSVTLIANNGSHFDTLTRQDYITVETAPVPAISFTRIDFITVEARYTGSPYDSIRWELPDNQVIEAMDTIMIQVTDYQEFVDGVDVRLTAWNDCGMGSIMETYRADAPYNYVLSPSREVCIDEPTSFVVMSTSGVQISWDFVGADQPAQMGDSVTVSYDSAGVYPLYLTVQEGSAMQVDTYDITVVSQPIADFEAEGITLTNQSMGATTYTWVVDGIVASMQEDHTLPDVEGEYDVLLVATNACGSDSSRQLIQYSSVSAPALGASFVLRPNPTSGMFVIERASSESAVVVLYTMDGRRVQQRQWVDGSHRMTWRTSLGAGVYLVAVQYVDGRIETDRLVILE